MFGFVILSHRSPNQLMRLCLTLNALYNEPAIACHHDFDQCSIDTAAFPSNVHFVRPSIATAWAKWSIVEATLAGLRLLYSVADPEHFYLISAADYPCARRETVERDLAEHQADAFIDAFELREALRGNAVIGDGHLAHHRAPHNVKLERGRYLRAQAKIPIVRFRPPAYSTTAERFPRLGRLTVSLPFAAPDSPFGRRYRCYVGSQWFTGNRKLAGRLLSPSPEDRKLQKFYMSRVVPDESYFQCVICNAADMKWENRTFRHAFWDGAHPIDLGARHLDAILNSGAHFARKFREDDPVLGMIDRHLGISD
jgi:hypothetical protein